MDIEAVIKQLADKICKNAGHQTPYNLIIKPEFPLDAKGREKIVVIKAGTPPILMVSRVFVIASMEEKKVFQVKDALARALEYLPKMYHTLSLIPAHEAVALRKDSRRWAVTQVPELKNRIGSHPLKLTNISVTFEDEITKTSITRNSQGNLTFQELCDEARADLTKMIVADDELREWRELVEESKRVKAMEVKPNEVSVSVSQTVNETSFEY